MSELVAFDPKAITEAIKGQIKSAIVAAIPEEQWSAMVDREVNAFIGTELPSLIKTEIRRQMSELLKAELQKPEYQQHWKQNNYGGYYGPGAAVKAILAELAPDMLKLMFSQIVQESVNLMRNQMNNR